MLYSSLSSKTVVLKPFPTSSIPANSTVSNNNHTGRL